MSSTTLLMIAAISVGAIIVTLALSILVISFLPKDFFVRPEETKRKRPFLKLLLHIAKNIAGWALIVAGLALSLPGIPGPGFVVVIIGLFMVDFPGKHKLQQRLIRKRGVSRTLNRVRTGVGKPAFDLPD